MLVAYVWAVDGLGVLFATTEIETSWATAQGFTRVHPGLVAPDSLPVALDLRAGALADTTVNIALRDVDATLAAIFGCSVADADDLVTTIEPGDTAPAAVWDRHVGLEAIGPAGERRRYSCVPGFEVGLRHLGANEAYHLGIATTPVTDSPVLWPGRRCAVYRLERETQADDWPDLADADRVWWGTMLGAGSHSARRWEFQCAGPESWLAGNLGRAIFEEPLRVVPLITIDTSGLVGQHYLFGRLEIVRLDDTNEVHHSYTQSGGVPTNVVDSTYLVGATTYEDIVAAFEDFLGDLANDNSSGTKLTDAGTSNLTYSTSDGDDGIQVLWRRQSDTTGLGGGASIWYTLRLIITAHEKVWLNLGYDVRTQNGDRDPVQNEEQYGLFRGPIGGLPGYWEAHFFAANARAMKAYEENDFSGGVTEEDVYNNGFARRWPPIYPGGAVVFDGAGRQEFRLDTVDPVYLRGSLSRPPLEDADDNTSAYTIDTVGDVTDQGLMVFEGPYRRRGDQDQVDPVEGFAFEIERERREGRTVQVARVSWQRNNDGSIALDSAGYPRLVVIGWADPRLYGFDFPRFTGTWGGFRRAGLGQPIEARPLTVFEYSSTSDRVTDVMRRVLLSTGTAGGWYTDALLTTPAWGVSGGALYLDRGDNDDGGQIPGDAETADLGLGVPSSMVAAPSVWASAQSQTGTHLGRCKAAFFGVVSARRLLRELISPTGLCWSLAGGKYGVIDSWRFPSPAAAGVTILTSEDYAGRPGLPSSATPVQALREYAPVDKIAYRGRVEPVAGDYARQGEHRSTDPGASYRSQTITHEVLGDHLIHPAIKVTGDNWLSDLLLRWRVGFAFWGRQHFTAEVDVHAPVGKNLWPGDPVIISDPWLADPSGSYGVSLGVGRVIARAFRPVSGKVTLKILINSETAPRFYAPGAVVTRYDEDEEGEGYRLLCRDDYFECRAGNSFDVDGFAEPAWSIEGGQADIEIFQFDGVSWTRGIYGQVQSVNSEEGDCWIELTGALTGATYYRDMHHVVLMRPWADQGAAWVKRYLAPVCEPDGTHSGGQPGVKFRGV